MSADNSPLGSTPFYLGGYTVDAVGLRMWPLRWLTAEWRDLTNFALLRRDGNRPQYSVRLTFASRRKPVSLHVGAGVANLRRLVQVLGWIESSLPHPSSSQQHIFDEFKAADRAVPDELLKNPKPTDEELLARARLRSLALEPGRAAKECAPLLSARGASEPEAALLTMDCRVAAGRSDDAVELFESVIPRHRNRRDLVARGAALLLDLDDSRGEQLASEALAWCNAQSVVVGLHWAAQHVRTRRWTEAETMLDRIAQSVECVPGELVGEIQSLRDEITTCKRSPAAVFKRYYLRPAVGLFLVVGIPLAIVALAAWSMWVAGPVYFHQAQMLRRLQASGVQVDATHVRELRRHDVRDSLVSVLTYAFVPSFQTAEAWEQKLPETYSPEALDAWLANLRAGGLPRGWFRGEAIVFTRTARAIEEDATLRQVTFLPADPTINTIGPITPARIWLTWLGGGKAVVFAVGILGTLLWLVGRAVTKRLTRGPVSKRPF